MASTGLYVAVAGAALAILLTWGLPLFLAEYFPWQSLYKQRHGKPTVVTKSYKGRTALITGANGAFGSRVAKLFAHREVETLVLVDVRDCGGVKAEIEAELKALDKPIPNILVWQADLLTFAGCQEVGKKAKSLKSLDHALLAAGILAFERRVSPEGWENSIQVNFLSCALISLLLMPVLKSSASNPNPPVMTFVTSFGIYPSSFTMGMPRTGSYLKHLSNNKDGLEQAHQYGRSKALLLYFARELAARITAARASGSKLPKVTITSADPGSAWTPLTGPNRANIVSRVITDFGARAPEICAVALTNGVSATAEEHGKIKQDFDTTTYPPFMLRASGQKAQQRVWEEAKAEFEAKAPEVKAVYELLG